MVKIDVLASYERIKNLILATPCIHSPYLSNMTGAKVYLKLENFNMTGSFKERGVASFLTSPVNIGTKHVVAASAGNHAQAVALFSGKMGIESTIFMPISTPNNKISQTKKFNAKVMLTGQSYDEAYLAAQEYVTAMNAKYLHAYNDLDVIAGQGSVGVELIQDKIEPDIIFVPVGGGGLVSGIACAFNELGHKNVKIIGVESEKVKSMACALKNKGPVMLDAKKTLADGIAVRKVGNFTHEICSQLKIEMTDVTDEEAQSCIIMLLERQKIIAEGAGAVSVASLFALAKKENLSNKKVVCIISGGNIDLALISRLTSLQMVKTSRILKAAIIISDSPGSLSALLHIVGQNAGNIIDIQHERSTLDVKWNEVLVILTIEVKDEEHRNFLLSVLEKNNYLIRDHLWRSGSVS